MEYLYDIFDNSFVRKALDNYQLPECISNNIKFDIRPYQQEAFKRYVFLDNEDLDEKPIKPLHLLYNMATGSGKTLIMAGLILYLYEKGYRNFLFFVNSNNILEKTKDNFLNNQALKYLFKERITINNKDVLIKEVDNFDEADENNINIKFVSIQMLTSALLLNVKENGLTFEDFENRKLVLIGDEAHHNNAEVWGDLLERIHKTNFENILLEFTATLDYKSQQIAEKYKDKVIYKYDLAEFRKDKYSKEINLIRSDYEKQERILQALVLNLYRQRLATAHDINLKPVILFKAKRTIKESEQNKQYFHELIESLSIKHIQKIKESSTVNIVKKAFGYFDNENITNKQIVNELKNNFQEHNCISANNDKEAQKNQIQLNTLEDSNNPIRAVFAVQKLNEGWDVLNLFDIVRLYETRDGKNGNPGKTTISEAQLIGRGARYYPFTLETKQDKYTRKYDDEIENDLKILEELYYHTKEDSKYITELKKALIETGIYEDDSNIVKKQLELKDNFKQTQFYKNGKVYLNDKVEKSFDNITSFADLGVSKTNYTYKLPTGEGKISSAFVQEGSKEAKDEGKNELKSKKIADDVPEHIIRYSLNKNPFFYFDNLAHYFPNVKSTSNFINHKDYLAGINITFEGTKNRLENINNHDYLNALNGLLNDIEKEVKDNSTEYEGSKFYAHQVKNIFNDKQLNIKKDDPRADGQEELVTDKDWYVFNANYGTDEEKNFVKLFASRFDSFKEKFENIYLVRNERALAIYNKRGYRFEPDFLLFCRKKKDKQLTTYQVFIEPKGKHLIRHEKWKEKFLAQIKKEAKIIDTDNYLITAVPRFYNKEKAENEFVNDLDEVLEVKV